MGTQFYMSPYPAYEPNPDARQSTEDLEQYFHVYLGDRDFNVVAPTQIYPLVMFTESKNSNYILQESFYETYSNHHGWVKTWISQPLEYEVLTGVTASIITSFGKDYDDYFDGIGPQMRPVVNLYLWKSTDDFSASLYHGTSTVTASFYNRYDGTIKAKQTFTGVTLSNATISDGDRICMELMWFDPDSSSEHYTHYFAFNGDPVSNKNYCKLSISADLSFMDSIYLENDTVRRGKNCLVMYPRTSLPEPPANPTVSTERWVNRRSSVNEYHMIDDFESYTSSYDMSLLWYTYGSGASYKYSRYTFASPTDFSDYDVISFYARAAPATVLSFFMKDASDILTTPASFSISNIWERYEATLSWGAANPDQIKYVYFSTSYYSDIRIDDVALLRMGADEENETWLNIDVTDYEYDREMKFNEVKIPYKTGKEIQFSGERNARGNITINDILNKNKNFLFEKMKHETPLYVRHRNHGLPINVLGLSPEYKNIGYNIVQTLLDVGFVEIYDDSLR